MSSILRHTLGALAGLLLTAALHAQGSLAPAAAPAPTQRTLEEIWNLAAQLEANNAALRAENFQQRRLLAQLVSTRLAWRIETVRRFSGDLFSGEAFAHTALAFAPGGQPVVAYQNVAAGAALELSRPAGDTWQPTSACSAQQVGRYTSLAIAPDGRPAIACYDSAEQDLIFTRQVGEFSWDWVRVDTAGDVGQHASLAFGPDGQPAIAYYDATNADLKLARFNGSQWQTETVAATGGVGSFARLTFFEGLPAIACHDATLSEFAFFRFDGSAWQREYIQSATAPVRGLSLALNRSGQATVVYSEMDGASLKLGTRSAAGSWSAASTGSGSGLAPSHAFGPDGQLAIAYRHYTTGALCYFRNGSGFQTVDANPANGFDYCSLAFRPDGFPAIAYYDKNAGSVKYAYRGIILAE